ncbi:hypothetical protein MNBD_GAMMA21-1719 [hydrothermal vent metagenome]|uniref:Uncharacterized protein n=1 Tax=hydrothermal vent metagenome TaxID=652676 RepID=A0A3B0ZXJ3_9ZZZZ
MNLDLSSLKHTVQNNCHIADSNAAGNYTLCIYLLKMREFYRWESGYDFGDNLPNEEVGVWLRKREDLWQNMVDDDFTKLSINGNDYDPFDSDSINKTLKPQHLVYSAGYGRNTNAHFVLGVLERNEHHNGFEIIVVADEYARDLTAPPAMSQGTTIYIRREAMRRMIWEKYEQWLWDKPNNAMARALNFYDFENDLDSALTKMTDAELNSAVLHEIGEVKAFELLGESWEKMLFEMPHSKLEMMLRAIRDQLADCLSTLPVLLAQNNPASLHFYFSNLTHMRKTLSPGLMPAYEAWFTNNDISVLTDYVNKGTVHWQKICRTVLELWKADHKVHANKQIGFIENNKL